MPKKHKHQSKQSKAAKSRSAAFEAAELNEDHSLHDLPAARLYITGLQNASGQSCFANAALQMLASSSQLMREDVKHVMMKHNGLPRAFMELLQGINSISTEKTAQNAVGVLDALAKTHAHMDGNSQQDSHEAVTHLLDMLQFEVCHGLDGDDTIMGKLFQGILCSTVTCMTCSSSSDSKHKSCVLSLPVSSEAQLSSETHVHRGWNHGQKDAVNGKAASVRESGRTGRKLTAKAQKSRDKGLRKEEKRRRKQEEQRKMTSMSTSNPDGSDEDFSDVEDEEAQTGGHLDDVAVGVGSRSASMLARSTSVKGIDLKRSMLERHGWSAPWLPGLWKLPNGDLFDVSASQTSLLISLQLSFEKVSRKQQCYAETDVLWKCPKAQTTLALIQKKRSMRAPGHVQIAERSRRETIFEVPGRSHATHRCLPGIEVWSHFIDDRPSLTWEKVWSDPFDSENRKIIQVAQISEQLWFENQHPSAIDEYNDPSTSSHLSQSCRFFELTLNNDLGSQYVETHQLAIPPIEFASEEDLARLSHLVAYQYNLRAEEYHMGEKIVEAIIMKAQILLECAHDALTELSPEGIGSLFGAPIRVRLQDSGDAIVEGWHAEKAVNVNVDSADTRQLFMQPNRVGDMTWLYPAPYRHADETSHAASMSDADAQDSSGELSASTAPASSPRSRRVIAESSTDDVITPLPPATMAASPGSAMKRVDSWMNDKFTAQPTRSHFPALSDRNFLMADDSDIGLPGNVSAGDEPADRSLQRSQLHASPTVVEAHIPLQVPRLSAICEATASVAVSKPIEACGGDDPMPSTSTAAALSDAKGNAGVVGVTSQPSQTSCNLASQGLDGDMNLSQEQACISRNILKEQQDGSCRAPASCECSACAPMPSQLCRIYPEKRGILVRPDNGLRLSERQMLVESLPPLLICHLKRFQHAGAGTRKNSLHVSFPFHMFIHPDVAQRSAGQDAAPDEAVRYRLKAVLEHHGRHVSSGHYTCYVWRPTKCACLAAQILQAARCHGRSDPVPVPKHSSWGKRRGRKDSQRHSLGSCPGISPKLAFSEGSRQLSHGGSLHSADVLPHVLGASVDAGSMPLSVGQETFRTESRSAVPGLESVGADVLDWEEIVDIPQEMLSVRSRSNHSCKSDSDQHARLSYMQNKTSSMGIDDMLAKSDNRLHALMASDEEDDIGVWVKCDDEYIEEVPWQTVGSAQAYMLMYEQAS